MPPFSRLWLLPLLCVFLYGCSLMPNEIKTAERIMETNPDSALHILQHMHTEKLMLSSSDRALYGLLLFQALDKSNKPLKPDSVINFSVSYYQHANDKPHLARSYFYEARLDKSAQRFDNATILYLKVLDLGQNNKDYILLGKTYSDLGDICSFQLDYTESLKKYLKAIDYFNKANDSIDASYKVIDIGRVYFFLSDYKKAKFYYNQALTQTSDSILKGSAYQGLGLNYYRAKQNDSAQYFLRKSLLFPYKGTNYAIRCYSFAEMFFDEQQYDSAFNYATKALKYPSTFYIQRDCYRILANSEYSLKNFKQMEFYMSKYQDCTDSVRKIEIQTKTTVLEDIHLTNGAFSKSRHFLIILGCIIPFIIALSLFIVYRLRKRSRGKEKQLEEVEVHLGEVEVQLSEKQNLLIDSLIQKIAETRRSQSSTYKKATLPQREQMDKDLYTDCLHLTDWDAFTRLMNKTFNNILKSFEDSKFDLTRKDLIWCCLFLLDVPTQDVVLVLEIQPVSLYKLKQRLTQKLNLNNVKELELFLKAKSERK